MSKEAKIVKCEIRWKDCNFYKMPNVYVIYEGKEEFEFLFDYYPDEISFTESEFIGLTHREAMKLFYKKDMEYLRS